jgi:Tfp pilus assembly protein PilE
MVEVMVVVVVIALLAAIAVPSYLNFKKKALATEARANLHQLYKLEFSYHEEYGAYTSNLSDIGFVTTPDMRYVYEVHSVWPQGFSARATANLDTDAYTDVWVVDKTGALRHVGID